ncbi:MAG: hypothetical protein ABDH19_06085 [Thermodesulfovibrio sp.]
MPKAVICEKNIEYQKTISDYLKSLGFECLIPSTHEEALGMINLEDISVIILGEEYSEIIKEISSFPMYRRREIIVFLLKESHSTMDRLSAFIFGADFIINPKDLNNFSAIFRKAYSEHQKTYKLFKEILAK